MGYNVESMTEYEKMAESFSIFAKYPCTNEDEWYAYEYIKVRDGSYLYAGPYRRLMSTEDCDRLEELGWYHTDGTDSRHFWWT